MVIEFNKKIYNKKAITGAIKKFKHLAEFGFTTKANYFVITIKKIDQEVGEIIRDEFNNYVLYLMSI